MHPSPPLPPDPPSLSAGGGGGGGFNHIPIFKKRGPAPDLNFEKGVAEKRRGNFFWVRRGAWPGCNFYKKKRKKLKSEISSDTVFINNIISLS